MLETSGDTVASTQDSCANNKTFTRLSSTATILTLKGDKLGTEALVDTFPLLHRGMRATNVGTQCGCAVTCKMAAGTWKNRSFEMEEPHVSPLCTSSLLWSETTARKGTGCGIAVFVGVGIGDVSMRMFVRVHRDTAALVRACGALFATVTVADAGRIEGAALAVFFFLLFIRCTFATIDGVSLLSHFRHILFFYIGMATRHVGIPAPP